MRAEKAASRTDDEAQIHELLERQARAILDKDAGRALDVYSRDAVCYDLDPPLAHGPAAVLDAARLQAWFDTWRAPIESERRDLRLELGADIAFAHSLQRMRGTKRDGEDVDLWYRDTTCLRREGGAWKILHAHRSVPFYMDGSDTAALDLDPDAVTDR